MSVLERSGEFYEDLYVEAEGRDTALQDEYLEERLIPYTSTSAKRTTSDSRSSINLTDPVDLQIKQEEIMRVQHERTIEDLHNRMTHLESELKGRAGRHDPGRDLQERLEVAIKQRDVAKQECESLRLQVQQIRQTPPETSSSEAETSLITRLSEVKKSNFALSQELKSSQLLTLEDNILKSMEERIVALDKAYEAQLQVTSTLQSRLSGSNRPKEVLQLMTKQIAANEAKIVTLEEKLDDAESQYLMMNRVMSNKDTPRGNRRVSSGSSREYLEEQSYARIRNAHGTGKKKKGKEGKEAKKKRADSEKPRSVSRKKTNNRP